ncbi:hypothetical protein HOC35_04145 [Candidatus Woesearchaeota archaeon]|jgi:hypothetical protein|nr:hypothetical protein [Candidatus Woesearchaeota archaeon]
MRKEKKSFFNKKNIIGLLIAFVMVSSLLGAWQGGYVAMDKYKDFKFRSKEYNVFGKIDGEWIQFKYHPTELESIEASPEALQTIKDSKMIYVTFDPEDKQIGAIELARIEIIESFSSEFNIYPVVGVTMNSSQYQAYPLMTCDNATSIIPVLYLKSSNETKITKEGDCIYVYGSNNIEFKPLQDRIRYSVYEVME